MAEEKTAIVVKSNFQCLKRSYYAYNQRNQLNDTEMSALRASSDNRKKKKTNSINQISFTVKKFIKVLKQKVQVR